MDALKQQNSQTVGVGILNSRSQFLDSEQLNSQTLDSKKVNSQTHDVIIDHCYFAESKIRVCSLNVCGLKSKLLSNDFEDFITNFDIVGLCETKLDELDDLNDALHDFCGFYHNRKGFKRASGGIALLVRKNLADSIHLIHSEHDHCAWFLVDNVVFGYQVIIGIVYIPPENSNYSSLELFEGIESDLALMHIDDARVCIMGDFNARTGTQSDILTFDSNIIDFSNEFIQKQLEHEQILGEMGYSLHRVSKDTQVNNYGRRLLSFCKNMGLMIANGRCGNDCLKGDTTCANVSVVDYVLCTPDLLCNITDFDVLPFCSLLSDKHNPVSYSIRKSKQESLSNGLSEDTIEQVATCKQGPVNAKMNCKLKWSKDKKNEFVDSVVIDKVKEVENFLDKLQNPLNSNIGQEDVDKAVEKIRNIFLDSAKTCNMVKKESVQKVTNNRKSEKKPWFNKDCEELRKKLFAAKKILRLDQSVACIEKVKYYSKLYKRELKKSQREYYRNLNRKLNSMSSKDPKEFWKMLKNKNKQNIGLNLECFKTHFQELNDGDEISLHEEVTFKNYDGSSNIELNRPITASEIFKCIHQLRNNKACGEDLILNEFLKSTCHIFVDIYVKLFNIILDTGIVPQDWLKGMIVPIYKGKGDKKMADNYRGITILSCFGKLFTSVINHRLSKYADEHSIIGPEQAGFRKGFSTLDHVLSLKLLIDFYLGQKKRLFCAFIDYRKAFDSVDRVNLWKKLISNNINGKLFSVIFNLYKHAKSCVKINGITSDYFNCLVGVRQGENLSPLLFAIFLSDLESFLYNKYKGLSEFKESVYNCLEDDDTVVYLNLFVLLYADDTIILAESCEQLQLAINSMKNYCDMWKLQLNASKTKILVFSRGKIRNKPRISYGEQVLEVVNSYTYLGITFNYNGSFSLAIKRLYDISSRAMFEILKKGRSLFLNIDTQLKLFDSVVVPILLYGCEIWGYSNLNLIEKLHLKFCKLILKLRKSTCSNMVYGELGRIPLNYVINIRMACFWNRIAQNENGKLSSIIYKVMLYKYKNNLIKSDWIKHTESIFNRLGLGYIWLEQGADANGHWLKNVLSQRVNDQAKQEWKSGVYSSSMCINYRLFKEEHHFEKYLNTLPPYLRIIFTKFRCRNFSKMPVVAGSYTNTPLDDRICKKCDNNSIGDEFHYVLQCDFFKDKREVFIKKYYYNRPSTFKFRQLFNVSGKEMVRLCQFLLYISKYL